PGHLHLRGHRAGRTAAAGPASAAFFLMSLLIISSSLNPVSHSRFLAEEAARVLAADGTPAVRLDLRDLPLPICDGDAAYGHPNVARARDLVRAADGLL